MTYSCSLKCEACLNCEYCCVVDSVVLVGILVLLPLG